MSKSNISVGLLGWGTVGTGVSKILSGRSDFISQHAGVELRLAKIAKRTLPAFRDGVDIPDGCLTTDPSEVVDNPEIDIVVELIGGVTDSRNLIGKAIRNGKHVVTANKALLAEHGRELFRLADENRVSLNFEASTAGGIPIIKTLRESFAANRIQSLYGIINGTCNFILSQMHEGDVDFEVVLKEAQAKGYAEADPTLDIEGHDAAQKLLLLTALAYGLNAPSDHLHVEGITKITQQDIQYARELGYVIKLLAIGKLNSADRVEIRVHPTLLPTQSLLANVGGAFNAVCVIGDAVGPTLFYGQGAGEMPTASAVVADIIDAGKAISGERGARVSHAWQTDAKPDVSLCPIDDVETRYYVRLVVQDKPGVLAQISSVLGAHRISIASVIQKERYETDETASLVIVTHIATEKNMQFAMKEIDALNVVTGESQLIRIEEEVAF
ncbi:MAG: homoserine dehydrogenase [Candidatus Poribacteria bacterium]|nr:homoserine dehydrogenase [Candidatus Poribacteria bacterium]MDE0503864.1 homoserine dehydrogenase [Candidatus Poribacteria bacterium]